jgi:BolA protein
VSAAFAGKSLVARHRMIYDLLGELMSTRIHALKIDARAV